MMAVFSALIIFLFGSAYNAQSKFELCKDIKFKSNKCEFQKKLSKY